jgi:Uncharacterised nucleotidyltransferase
VTPRSQTRLATAVLRLLLDRRDPPPADAPWDDWVVVLERNAVLLRVADRLEALGGLLPRPVAVATVQTRARSERVLHLMRQVADACERHGIPHVFPKALPHLPDVGGDVDLLVPAPTNVDPLILDGLGAALQGPGVSHALSGSRVYHVPGPGLDLDIHHGRVGRLGEHRELATRLVQNRRRVFVAGVAWWVPAPEDALVLQGLDRIAGRRSFRIADVVSTIGAVRDGLDWDVVLRTAEATGTLPGLSCYLTYVSQIHREALGRELALPPLGVSGGVGWGRAEFHHGAFRFPAVRVNGAVYARAFGSAVAQRRWVGAGRLLLLPLVAATALRRSES